MPPNDGILDERTPLLVAIPIEDDKLVCSPLEVRWMGMNARELRQYANDPYWVRLRKAFFCAYWVTLGALLVSAIWLATHVSRPEREETFCVYQLVVDAFRDSDGSGSGDLKGIQTQLDYISGLGVNAVWLSPIYKSPMVDFGYDIEDFRNIDEKFGTISDFKKLVQELKKRDLKLIMDFVPNHSSDQHEWFKKSIKMEDPYTHYYIWAPPKEFINGTPVPPNNWLSVFGGSAWEWNTERKSFYLHQFTKEQPDLNFRNPLVVQEMMSTLEYWLEQGVDGFRIDALAHLFEDEELRDEPSSDVTTNSEYDKLNHIYTQNLPEVMDVLLKFRQVIDDYSNKTDNIKRLLIAEVYASIENTMKYYGSNDEQLADFPFNFLFITNLSSKSSASDLKDTVDLWLNNMPKSKTPNWVLGNHDKSRVATRLGKESVDAMNMMLLLLPGTAITYYGEELGMEDTPLTWKQTVDPFGRNAGPDNYTTASRDPQRTPMQWNDKKNAGFSDANSTWLPVNSNYKTVNVEAEMKGKSHLTIYKTLVKTREEPAIKFGRLDMAVLNDNKVFAFTRTHPGANAYAVLINMSHEKTVVDISGLSGVPRKANIYISSTSQEILENVINTKAITLESRAGIVLEYVPIR